MFGDFDLNALMQQAQKLQDDMERAQSELSEKEFTASAGGDLVTVTMNGKGELLQVAISPDACDPDDTETLSALIIAAFRSAKAQADAAMAAAMPEMPQIPGM
ncbi:nucleoid-associated protein [Tessaracoccus aquimaris]|uniref:Nucleoid-associated protein BW730_17580 n=1 Tax=Tessaracoccus aquimaris TaxID=1332264 RepID=A0A1Q2CSE3_9ACTN|nr:YbaB/EbfC family nucleoid-associated protein [Tessaracoccus aquimaris]AQP49036.1 nucleoid-associated protein [Tessaracoccus aquimaris]